MNRYKELKSRQQKEFDEVPLGFAFSEEQFNAMMKGWGLDPDKDLDKIAEVSAVGYIQKKDIAQLKGLTARHKKEMEEAVAGDTTGEGFIYEMFLHELNNNEYGYTGDVSDTLEALGLDLGQVEADSRLKRGLEKAEHEIIRRENALWEPSGTDTESPTEKKSRTAKTADPAAREPER